MLRRANFPGCLESQEDYELSMPDKTVPLPGNAAAAASAAAAVANKGGSASAAAAAAASAAPGSAAASAAAAAAASGEVLLHPLRCFLSEVLNERHSPSLIHGARGICAGCALCRCGVSVIQYALASH